MRSLLHFVFLGISAALFSCAPSVDPSLGQGSELNPSNYASAATRKKSSYEHQFSAENNQTLASTMGKAKAEYERNSHGLEGSGKIGLAVTRAGRGLAKMYVEGHEHMMRRRAAGKKDRYVCKRCKAVKFVLAGDNPEITYDCIREVTFLDEIIDGKSSPRSHKWESDFSWVE